MQTMLDSAVKNAPLDFTLKLALHPVRHAPWTFSSPWVAKENVSNAIQLNKLPALEQPLKTNAQMSNALKVNTIFSYWI